MKKKNLDRILLTVVTVLLSLLVIVPLAVVVLGSFKNEAEAQLFNLKLPTEWIFENYTYVIIEGSLMRAFFNSLIITVAVVLIVMVASSLCAFVISRKHTRYTVFVYNLFVLGLVAPLQIVTTYGLLKALNLTGTYIGVIMIISAVQMPWAIFIMYGFIKSVPRELDEAAFIDGASPLYMFFKIILPLLKPILGTVLVIVAMAAWNDFMIPLYFFNTSSSLQIKSQVEINGL